MRHGKRSVCSVTVETCVKHIYVYNPILETDKYMIVECYVFHLCCDDSMDEKTVIQRNI